MTQNRLPRWLKANIDAVDIWTVCLAFARYAAFVAWADVIVRAIRGEEAEENWKTFSSSAILIGLSALQSGTEIREFASLRGAAVEMRHLVDDAAKQAELRDQHAAERDRRAEEQQERALLLNKRMVALASLTLVAAIVTLAVALVQ